MPLLKSIDYLAPIEFLRSFSVIYEFIKEYKEGEANYLKHKETDNILNSIRKNYANEYDQKLEDSDTFLKEKLKFKLTECYDYFSEKHFIFESGKIYLANDMIEEYQLLSSSIDITTLISHYLLKITDDISNQNRLRYIENSLDEELYFKGDLEQKFSTLYDMHIHLGGSLSFEYRLHRLISYPKEANFTKLPDELFIKLFENDIGLKGNSILYMLNILENSLIYFFMNSFDKNVVQIVEEMFEAVLNKYDYGLYEQYKNINNLFQFRKSEKFNDILYQNYKEENFLTSLLSLSQKYFIKNEVKYADKLLVISFIYALKKEEYKIYHTLIKIYLILRNILKTYLVQQHRRTGLGYFSSYSSNNTLRREKNIFEKKDILLSILHPKMDTKIEGRLTLSKNPKEIINSIKGYIDALSVIKEEINYRKRKHEIKFLFHFTRKEDEKKYHKEWQLLKPRWYLLRDEIKKKAMALHKILENPSYKDEIKMYSSKRRYKYRIKSYKFIDYIGGIDVASKENLTPPEVFAPVFRYFKINLFTSSLVLNRDYPFLQYDNMESIKFNYSYHVGEDFRDIITGLRNIFEAVVFLQLSEGDRIGHALALGVDPEKFLARRRYGIKLTKHEVLDNAIFAYYILSRFGTDKFYDTQNKLRDLILRLSREIYSTIIKRSYNIVIDDLIDAWLLRRNCPKELDILENFLGLKIDTLLKDCEILPNKMYIKAALPDFVSQNYPNKTVKRYKNIIYNKVAIEIYKNYQFDDDVFIKGQEFFEENFKFETEFYEYLQDIIMEKIIAKNDIVIEILPTSNILIGAFERYSEHPILRFKPVDDTFKPNRFNIRKKKIRVVLGTDNPGIQNSSILMEFYQLRNFLIKRYKYSHSKVDDYLSEIMEESKMIYERR